MCLKKREHFLACSCNAELKHPLDLCNFLLGLLALQRCYRSCCKGHRDHIFSELFWELRGLGVGGWGRT